ncbi:hypothetical protein [Ferrovibrio sp.]|uniref:hypothetical protein n=1 Tax=Ferrovibrio sp. TaxID=1917215 RepID=UPI002634CC0F|nr:hypothetical protein [Ferrovibrio sp.]
MKGLSAENGKLRRQALELLGQVERQGLDITEAYRHGMAFTDQFGDFKRFIDKVDHFHVFVDLVEERLPKFEPAKRAALARHLAEIRWRIVVVEVDSTQVFLVRIGESHRPWPLGSRQFLERRLRRLDEILDYYDRHGQEYDLAPLGSAMLHAVEDLLKAQIERAPGLDDFSFDVAAAAEADRAAPRRRRRRMAASGATSSVAVLPPAGPPRLRVRELGGRFYVDRDGIMAVTEICRTAKISMDQLAAKLGVSRATLVLMLNGSDPISRGPLDMLRNFVTQNGGLAA